MLGGKIIEMLLLQTNTMHVLQSEQKYFVAILVIACQASLLVLSAFQERVSSEKVAAFKKHMCLKG